MSFRFPRTAQNGTVHYNDVIMGAMASQITSLTIVYSAVYLSADQRKHQSSTSLAFVQQIHLGPVNSPHKWPVTRKLFPFDEVIMAWRNIMTKGWLALVTKNMYSNCRCDRIYLLKLTPYLKMCVNKRFPCDDMFYFSVNKMRWVS